MGFYGNFQLLKILSEIRNYFQWWQNFPTRSDFVSFVNPQD